MRVRGQAVSALCLWLAAGPADAGVFELPPGVTYGTRWLSAGDTLVGAHDGSSVIDASVALDDWVDLGDGTWAHAVVPSPHWLRVEPPLIVDGVAVGPKLAERYRPVLGPLGDRSGYRIDPDLYPEFEGLGLARLFLRKGNKTAVASLRIDGDTLRFGSYRPSPISKSDAVRLQHTALLGPGEWCYVTGDRVVFRTDGPAPTGVRRMDPKRACVSVRGADGATVRGVTLRHGMAGLDVRDATGVTLRDVTVAGCGEGLTTRSVASLTVTGLTVRDCHVGARVRSGARDVRLAGCRFEGIAADVIMLPPGLTGFTLADSHVAGAREFGHGDCLQQVALARRDDPPARDLNIVGNTFADGAQGLIFDAAEDVRIVGNTFGPRIAGQCLFVKGGRWNPNRRFVISGNRFLAPGISAVRVDAGDYPLEPAITPVITHNVFRVIASGAVRGPAGAVWEDNEVTWSPAVRRAWSVRFGEGGYGSDRSSPTLAPEGVPLAVSHIDFGRIGHATPTEIPIRLRNDLKAGDAVSVDGFAGRYRVASTRPGWVTLADPLPGHPVLRGAVWAWEREARRR